MKKKFMTVIIANALCIGLFVQEKEAKSITPPGNMKATFEKTFTGASKVKWKKEGNDYEVNFVQQKKRNVCRI